MLRKFRSFGLIVLFVAVAMTLAAPGYAGEGENSITSFFKNLFNFSGKTVEETGAVTSKAMHNTGEKVVSKTGEHTAAVLSGDVARTGNLATEPVVGAAETTGQAVSETVQIPVKAAQGVPAE